MMTQRDALVERILAGADHVTLGFAHGRTGERMTLCLDRQALSSPKAMQVAVLDQGRWAMPNYGEHDFDRLLRGLARFAELSESEQLAA